MRYSDHARSFQKRSLSGQVLAVVDAGTSVAGPVVRPAFAGSGLAVLRMEAAQVAGQCGECDVVNGEVKVVGSDLAFIRDCDAGRGGKGHLEVGIERFNGSHCQERGLIDEILAQSKAKEVADGDLDRGRRLPGPPEQLR